MAKKLHACSTADSLTPTPTPIQPMAHPSKRKANRHEREIVRIAEAKGFESERAYASNGESLGEVEACDVFVRGRDDNQTDTSGKDALRIQAKRRASIASYLNPPEGTDAVVVREDRGDNLLVLPFKDLLEIISRRRKSQ
jgi:Holliday junction resolvase